MTAAYNGHKYLAGLLLDHGANIRAADDKGWTALAFAANREYPDTVMLLLQRGSSANRAHRILARHYGRGEVGSPCIRAVQLRLRLQQRHHEARTQAVAADTQEAERRCRQAEAELMVMLGGAGCPEATHTGIEEGVEKARRKKEKRTRQRQRRPVGHVR